MVKQFMIIGLPASGKTTLLAAFWYMADQTCTECALTIDRLEGDRKYLNRIRDAWLECKPVPRNWVDFEKLLSMALKRRENGVQINLKVPDLSGETFRQQWAKRELASGYNNLLRESQGALLFIGPDLDKPHRIDMVDELSNLVPGAAGAGEPDTTLPKAWNIEDAPTQVQLIELLQIIATRDYFEPGFKLAIIVSAYDLHNEEYPEPEIFLSKQLPMLDQFLRSNGDLFDATVFGVSAQGSVYASPVLTSEMLINFNELTRLILTPGNEIHRWIHQAVKPATIEALRAANNEGAARELLTEDFNALLGKIDFYDLARFASVSLRDETKSHLEEFLEKENKDTTEIRILNRKILEDVFPRNISKKWQNRKEHQKLVDLPAARRVAVFGKAVKNKHDITEPIQWLMS